MIKKNILIALSSIMLLNCSNNDEIIDQNSKETIGTVYTLPVVVHVVHTGEDVGLGYNLSNERIIGQIKTLNDDFRKKSGTIGYNTHPLGTDSKIEFKLAEIDPEGNSSDGIKRVNIHDIVIDIDNDWLFDDLPYYGYWNKQDYINVWVFPFEPNIILGQSSVPRADLPGLEDAIQNGTTGIMITTPHFGASSSPGKSALGTEDCPNIILGSKGNTQTFI